MSEDSLVLKKTVLSGSGGGGGLALVPEIDGMAAELPSFGTGNRRNGCRNLAVNPPTRQTRIPTGHVAVFRRDRFLDET